MSKYECDQCGACCKSLLVETYELDVIREPKLLSANIGTWTRDKTREQIMMRLQEEDTCLIIAGPSKPCCFLGQDNKCSIYPTRPNVCVAMEAGDEQCQMGRQSAGLEPLTLVDATAADSSMQERDTVDISKPSDFVKHFEEAFDRLDRTEGRLNFVSLVDLRRELPEYNPAQFDAGIKELRRRRIFTLSSAEGRFGISEDQKNAAILEAGSLLLFVSRRS